MKDRLDWMGELDTNDGKLQCPCGWLVGNFEWSGSQCSCGKWITPSLKIIASKIDKARPFVQPKTYNFTN